MSWIKTISYGESENRLRGLYDRIKSRNGYLDNIVMIHGLRPHTLEGHMKLYTSVMHHSGNVLPKPLQETIGLYTSMLNRCAYCVEHHFRGLRRLLQDDDRANRIHQAFGADSFEYEFDERERAIFKYVKRLTLSPRDVEREDIEMLREQGLSDAEILEINQVTSYFAYANRTVLGLGCNTEGDILGLSPEDSDEWHHG